MTHDRVVHEDTVNIFETVDLLVIDEVYKLQKDMENERVLLLNMAYYNMVKKCRKYILLAPFISGVENIEMLEKTPVFINTNYSPVVNDVSVYEIAHEDDRVNSTEEVLRSIPLNENTLVYFPTVKDLNQFIVSSISEVPIEVETNSVLQGFIEWAKNEIHEEWTLTKALSNGYLVHHGQLPLGIRLLQLDLFNENIYDYTRLLCTSTLLEGVNTTAKHVIITKPCRGYGMGNFDAFDFYNLFGRTGRLYEHYLGLAHYIKGPNDPIYVKDEALKTIEFELTDESIDIDINCDNYGEHPNFIAFLEELGISYEEYKKNIGPKCRFSTVTYLYQSYTEKKEELLSEVYTLGNNSSKSKLGLIRILYEIIKGKKWKFKRDTFIINRLTYLTRPSVRDVVNATHEYYKHEDINDLISKTISLKSSFIEYEFLNKVEIIMYFMECEKVSNWFVETIYSKLVHNIEVIYFLSSPSKRLLKDIGIFDRDIETIVKLIGEDFSTVEELIALLRRYKNQFDGISILSRYVLNNLI